MNLTSSTGPARTRIDTGDLAADSAPGPLSDRVLFTAAPALFLGGWLLMRPIDGQSEPGGWWTAAHAVWLAGFVLFAAMGPRFGRIVGARTTGQRIALTASTVIVVVSSLANIVQLVIDLVGGFTSADSAELKNAFSEVKDIPGAEALIYGVGAQLVFVGLIVFAVLAAVVRRATPGSAALVTMRHRGDGGRHGVRPQPLDRAPGHGLPARRTGAAGPRGRAPRRPGAPEGPGPVRRVRARVAQPSYASGSSPSRVPESSAASAARSSGSSSKPNTSKFSTIRDGVTDLGITTLPS